MTIEVFVVELIYRYRNDKAKPFRSIVKVFDSAKEANYYARSAVVKKMLREHPDNYFEIWQMV